MPLYHALVRPGLMTEAQRQTFARDVVDVHCGVTGAPPSFMHSRFTEGDQLPDGMNAVVNGTIRAGRTDAQKAEIAERLSQALADAVGVDAATVRTATRDIDASYTMEGGVLLPEPGSAEERDWTTSSWLPRLPDPAGDVVPTPGAVHESLLVADRLLPHGARHDRREEVVDPAHVEDGHAVEAEHAAPETRCGDRRPLGIDVELRVGIDAGRP